MTIQESNHETILSLVPMRFYDGRKVHLGVLESWNFTQDAYGFSSGEWVDSIPLPLCSTHSNYLGQMTNDEVTCERCLQILSHDAR